MKLSKCHFFSKEIQYLGHILSTKGIHPLPSKTQAIQKMYPPTTPKQVCAFLGLVGYYRKFIQNFAKIAKLLTLLTRQEVKFKWTPEHQEAFMKLKDSIIQAPILQYPNPSKRYIGLHRCIGPWHTCEMIIFPTFKTMNSIPICASSRSRPDLPLLVLLALLLP